MILAHDVYYYEEKARSVLVAFNNWTDEAIVGHYEVELSDIAEYEPGSFYKRELPCILEVLKLVDLDEVEAIVVDGYVTLNDEKKPGLGQYLYKALDEKIPIIGVAKNSFANNEKYVEAIRRGSSNKPLYITAVGLPLKEVATKVQNLKGPYRIPDLLKLVDAKSRGR